MPNVERAQELLKLAQPLLEALTGYARQLEILAIVTGGSLKELPTHTPAFIDTAYTQGQILSVTPAVLLRGEPPVYQLTINGIAEVIIRCLDIETGFFAYDVYRSTHEYHHSVHRVTMTELASALIALLGSGAPELCGPVL